MERLNRFMLTALLLLGVAIAWAQSGTIQGNDCSLRYSLSGGTVVKNGQMPAGPKQLYYTCEAKAGTTVSLTIDAVNNKANRLPYLRVEVRRSAQVNSEVLLRKTISGKNASYSYTIPKDAGYVSMIGDVQDGTRTPCVVNVSWKVVEKPSTPAPAKKPVKTYEKRINPDNCPHCHQKISHYDIADYSGEVKIRCFDEEDDSYEFVDLDTPIYGNDLIDLHDDESKVVLSYYNGAMRFYYYGECRVHIINEREQNKLEMLFGSMIGNIKRMAEGKLLDVEMSEIALGINGTIFAVKETGSQSSAWLFAGSVTAKSKRTGKRITLQPGQCVSAGRNGVMNVQDFDIEKEAKKWGIKMSDIQNHYSNTGNNGLVFTADKINYKILSNNTVEVTGELRGNYKGRVSIPSQVKHNGTTYRVVGIGKNAFANQTNMTSVDIPSSVVTIKEDAFNNAGLTQVSIPGNSVKIAKWAFHNCRKLTTATVSGRTPNCSPEAFVGCSSMRELYIRDIKPQNYGKRLTGTNAIIKKL